MADGADMLVVTETWRNPGTDGAGLPGYRSFSCSRRLQSSQRRPNGGLACFVRLPLANYASIWRVAHDASLLWLWLDKNLSLHRDLHVCAACMCCICGTQELFSLEELPLEELPLLMSLNNCYVIADAQVLGDELPALSAGN